MKHIVAIINLFKSLEFETLFVTLTISVKSAFIQISILICSAMQQAA